MRARILLIQRVQWISIHRGESIQCQVETLNWNRSIDLRGIAEWDCRAGWMVATLAWKLWIIESLGCTRTREFTRWRNKSLDNFSNHWSVLIIMKLLLSPSPRSRNMLVVSVEMLRILPPLKGVESNNYFSNTLEFNWNNFIFSYISNKFNINIFCLEDFYVF